MMATINDDLKDTIKLMNEKVSKNIEVETPEQLGQDYLLHIAIMKFKELVPNISRRAAPSEDNTLPRVHVAPTITECIQGYASVDKNIDDLIAGIKHVDGSVYKGGYYLYKIPFEYCIKPNKKLVYDSDVTNERWLITYDKKTKTYDADIVGKLIPINMVKECYLRKTPVKYITLCLEISEDVRVKIDQDIEIGKGYYQFEILDDVNKPKIVVDNFKSITKKEFDKLIELKVDNLSHSDVPNKPFFTKW